MKTLIRMYLGPIAEGRCSHLCLLDEKFEFFQEFFKNANIFRPPNSFLGEASIFNRNRSTTKKPGLDFTKKWPLFEFLLDRFIYLHLGRVRTCIHVRTHTRTHIHTQ